ncbi:methoxymalonate biosynthesis protein hbmH [Micromonospora sp. ATCC 39149]|uniref:HAD-IIIC family phosphatase n=1 Tax=Micromonospora carbonacea TaxID=47853 RepID=A0A7D5Y6I1_9ACTN|nr:HAD-IIIC family phosphatase [Micromonospora sp. ATCC 39149]EEP70233.1 methoxymalonate biosynthesis protein hbmH [Micromonospora sp. ATCC 39149]QLJ96659.1 HAD-IIIC family phosphatase [Micromonospora carbonacea]
MAESPTLIKCLVWDLDNTLWKGTLLEDDQVSVADDVRRVVQTLDARGILQSVASKNDHDLAWRKLEELGLAEYFVLPRINWGRKSDSVLHVADRLRFAQGTIAFVDDQPAERAEVQFRAPAVRCYRAEDVAALLDRPEFNPPTVTVDAARRRLMYQASFRREEAQATFTGPDEEFLHSLRLRMTIERATETELDRVEELTLRTSQMNATGVHYSDATLRGLLDDPGHEVLVTTMADRFGPHGAVGVLLLAASERVWHLKLLATSCRVVSFGAGSLILNWLTDQASRARVHLVADFRRTDRNRMMDVAYRLAGYGDDPCDCLAKVPPADAPEIQRLHLVPARRDLSTVITLTAPNLARERRRPLTPPAARPR